MSLFRRDYKIEFFGNEGKIEIRNLDIEFRLVRDIEKNDPTGTLSVFGLSRESKNRINDMEYLRFFAGYIDNMNQIFAGKMINIKKSQKKIEVEFGEGKEVKETKINKTYRSGVNAKNILTDLTSKFTNKENNFSLSKLKNVVFKNGISINDTAAGVMDLLSQDMGADITTENEEIKITNKDENVAGITEFIELDYSSGLLSLSQEEDKKIKFKSLLISGVSTNDYVKVFLNKDLYAIFTGEEGSGYIFVKVEKAIYSGDFSGNNWTIEAIARKVE